MIAIAVVGDPDKVCSFVSSLMGSGYFVCDLKKTKNNATYIITYDNAAPGESYLLLENGDYILLEDGSKIILE